MRYQHARVVLAACLFAAAAAAQGTFDGSKTVGYESTGFGLGRFVPNFDSAGDSASDSAGRRIAAAVGQQQDPTYERRELFQQHHGDFMNRRERYEPMISIGGSYAPSASIKNEDGHFDEVGYFADIDLPWNVSTDGYLLFGAYYQAKHYNFVQMGIPGNGPGGALNDETLTGTGVKLGFGGFLDHDGNILLEVEVAPGIWSDMDDGFHHKDFDFPGHAVITYRAVDNLFFKIGARYNQVYEDAPWLPVLGLSWDISGAAPSGAGDADLGGWRLDVWLPERAEVSYWPSGSTGWLLGAEVTGAEYRVHTSEATGSQQDDVRVQEIVAYFGMVHRMSDYFSLTGRVGMLLAGDYDLTNGAAGYNHVEGSLGQSMWAEFSFGIDF